MQFTDDNPLAIFENIDITNATLEDWIHDIIKIDGFEGICLENYQQVIKYATAQFNFLKAHKNLSGLYFVDWRVGYSNLEEFILAGNFQNTSTIAKDFFEIYDKESVKILYERLGQE